MYVAVKVEKKGKKEGLDKVKVCWVMSQVKHNSYWQCTNLWKCTSSTVVASGMGRTNFDFS